MKKTLNLVIQDLSDPDNPIEFVESFKLSDDVKQPEQALRNAVSEFINSGTVEAQEALDYANGCFNWGDAMKAIPRKLFSKHGLTLLKQNSIDIFVDHNEILNFSGEEDTTLANVKKLIKEHISSGEKDISYWLRGKNIVAESIAEQISDRNKKLIALLEMKTLNENTIKDLIKIETDDDLIIIYESILDEITT